MRNCSNWRCALETSQGIIADREFYCKLECKIAVEDERRSYKIREITGIIERLQADIASILANNSLQIVTDYRAIKTCVSCENEVRESVNYCSNGCRQKAYRQRKKLKLSSEAV